MHRPQKNSKLKSFRLCYTGNPTRAQDTHTRSRFLGYYCGFFPLVPIGGVTMIFCDTDMVFY